MERQDSEIRRNKSHSFGWALVLILVCVLLTVSCAIYFRTERQGQIEQVQLNTDSVILFGAMTTVSLVCLFSLVSYIQSLRRSKQTSKIESLTDELTGLPNKRWLLNHLNALEVAESTSVALFFCDLDRFKIINDSMGHSAGDTLLQETARRLTNKLKDFGKVIRFGGDEFIVCIEVKNNEIEVECEKVAEQILEISRANYFIQNLEITATISVGIATHKLNSDFEAEKLIRDADTSLHQAKGRGGNRSYFFTPNSRIEARNRLFEEQKIRKIIKTDGLSIFLQPIFDNNFNCVSLESLVRIRSDGEIILPNKFLPIVKDLGLDKELGNQVLTKALKELKIINNQLPPENQCTLHVNIDPVELEDLDYAEKVNKALEAAGILPSMLTLELTENAFSNIFDDSITTLTELSAFGIGLAIDDFGAGHSTLIRILDLPAVTEVKIDRSVCAKATKSKAATAVIAGLISAARDLSLKVVAEGIETEEEHHVLSGLGADYFQGFRYSRPIAPDKALEFILQNIDRNESSNTLSNNLH